VLSTVEGGFEALAAYRTVGAQRLGRCGGLAAVGEKFDIAAATTGGKLVPGGASRDVRREHFAAGVHQAGYLGLVLVLSPTFHQGHDPRVGLE